MKAKAHVIGGMIFTGSTIYLLKHYDIDMDFSYTEIVCGGFFGSLLPDIDHKKSLLGSIVHLPVKHRTLTHSLFFLLLVSTITAHYTPSLAIGLFVGILSHLILDMVGRKSAGICLLYPSKKKFSFFRIR
ncbi:MAG: metal-dependent hydrolase [Clostridiales bacterium]|nr:metal-dependent hydrolase [Clostridiales bacterium]